MKKIVGLLAIFVIGNYVYISLYGQRHQEDVMGKKVALVIASNGFQEHEYQETRKVLENAGYVITVVSDKQGMAIGNEGLQISVDTDIAHMHPIEYLGVYIIGGPGAITSLDNPIMHKILNEVFAIDIPYGAICLAPRILAQAQVLRNKQATGWDGDGQLKDIFQKNQVTLVQKAVVVDGNVVTANGPSAAQDFGLAIVETLSEKMNK